MTQTTSKTVLIVDDDAHIRVIVETIVKQKRGHATQTATTGQRALDLLRSGLRPDLILMDVVMPELNGFETLEEIRRDPELRAIPVVLLTAQSEESDMFDGYESGADYYLNKPIDIERLLRIVDFLIGDLPPEERLKLEPLL